MDIYNNYTNIQLLITLCTLGCQIQVINTLATFDIQGKLNVKDNFNKHII